MAPGYVAHRDGSSSMAVIRLRASATLYVRIVPSSAPSSSDILESMSWVRVTPLTRVSRRAPREHSLRFSRDLVICAGYPGAPGLHLGGGTYGQLRREAA